MNITEDEIQIIKEMKPELQEVQCQVCEIRNQAENGLVENEIKLAAKFGIELGKK